MSAPENPAKDGAPAPKEVEAHLLRFSVYGAIFFALLGLVWGVAIRSQMIVFDGIYSFISVITASVSVFAAFCMQKGEDRAFPFGRWQMEPMAIVLKSLVLIALCLNAIFMAVYSLMTGGVEVNVASGAAYSFLGAAGCIAGWVYISRQRKKAGDSGLVESEAMQWLMDGLLSAAILAGFLIAFFLEFTAWASYARYADPVMTLAAAVFFLRTPLVALIQGVRDLLLMSPDTKIRERSRVVLGEIAREEGFCEVRIGVGQTGQILFFTVTYLNGSSERKISIGEMDRVIGETERRLAELFDQPRQVSVCFTADPRWAG